ncbi:phosphoribosylaminoimidazolesuccinocarboxamide synthase [Herpetosiphon geysericola]|uniref:Phosphoribosylaminoimidazole-succinocarboxamide synthase n=1 Tax=Herpetosiphon geysericola TaxID=70996 RepID=A0A0N8GPM1_9CHLR|nr:phosphoribosylaminoimidazolesuccinocarboxamide synthase [Herpetosiphon geysericola]KPL81282.1 phosphoribosylaminoimidazole-succinocarboxamide synthase [Herpetosiphon geysericola]
MQYGTKLAEGKTKIIYAHPEDQSLAYMLQKDSISAGDGARRNEIEGKGAISGRTSANVFALLNRSGVRTHYKADPEPGVMVVERCDMLPLEVVMRRLATGSYCRRHPETPEGTRFSPPLVEFFYKDDANHDPQIDLAGIVEKGLATAEEVHFIEQEGTRVFELLEQTWAERGVQLVDLKIEFGRTPDGTLIVADMIDNDSWRLWPDGDKSKMLDKQIYRNLQTVTDEALQNLKAKYEEVRDITESFR